MTEMQRGLAYVIAFPFAVVGWVSGFVVGAAKLITSAIIVGYKRGLGVLIHD